MSYMDYIGFLFQFYNDFWLFPYGEGTGVSVTAAPYQGIGKVYQSTKTGHDSLVTRQLFLAGATGLEPATSGVTGRRSNQLNYAPNLLLQELFI
jgi:hypothetical protein